jgi:hypothetical protein
MTANVTLPPSNGGLPSGLSSDRVTRGMPGRWTETACWVDRDGLPLPRTMFVIGYITVLRRWKDKKPIDNTEHPLPDPKDLNAAIPLAEWEIGPDGKPVEPWKLTYVIYMVDLKTGALYTYANSTYGAMLCFTTLEEQVTVMRVLRGEHVLPIVNLEQRPMKTTYGWKKRPHLEIVEWRAIGGSPLASQSPTPQLTGPATAAAPPPAAPAAVAPAPALAASAPTAPTPAAPTPAASVPTASAVLDNTEPLKPVTVAELIADELPPWA